MIRFCSDNPSNKKVLKSSETGSSHLKSSRSEKIRRAQRHESGPRRQNEKRVGVRSSFWLLLGSRPLASPILTWGLGLRLALVIGDGFGFVFNKLHFQIARADGVFEKARHPRLVLSKFHENYMKGGLPQNQHLLNHSRTSAYRLKQCISVLQTHRWSTLSVLERFSPLILA